MWWAEARDGCNLLVWLSACFHVVRAGIWTGGDCGVRYSALAGDAGLYLCLVRLFFQFLLRLTVISIRYVNRR